jgi:crotonobetainyl-CoA:carnitine CoA-transferase CaiB-like acyl-CoA transferase
MEPGVVADTLLGKRSAFVDLRDAAGQVSLQRLLDHADVVVCGYRPGALEALGLDVASSASRSRGIAVIYLDAWGHSGPWRARRGFDSIVQAAVGIATAEGSPDEPGALPCQLLDHGTGYLAAAAALDACRRQFEEGGTHIRRLSLARTAHWLTSMPRDELPEDATDTTVDGALVELDSDQGPVTAVAPPGAFDGEPLQWPHPLTRYGADSAEWSKP